ncbi:MAG: hypothetical protein LW698_05315 [Planctomycetaceae bacterium]|nr:hypothetical protein [Planctomycetaceae bacterium]
MAEAPVAEERLAEVAHAHHRHAPGMVGAEDVAHRPDQLVAAVADARIAELAEEAEVLADLGVAEPQQRAELAGGDRLLARGLEPLQLPEVEADPADHDLRHGRVGRRLARLCGLRSGFGHGKACRKTCPGGV